MDKWIKLHLRKTLLNLAVRFLNFLVPDKQPKYPQTQLLERVYNELLKAYRVEAYCGRFDDVPCQTLEGLKDRNFLNLLELSRKALFYLGDTDRYYRMWLGLACLKVHDAVDEQQKSMGFDGFLESASSQWDFDMRGAFPPEYFGAHKREFQEIMLTNNLCNLTGGENKR